MAQTLNDVQKGILEKIPEIAERRVTFPLSVDEAAELSGLSKKRIQQVHAINGIGRINKWKRLEFSEADFVDILIRKQGS